MTRHAARVATQRLSCGASYTGWPGAGAFCRAAAGLVLSVLLMTRLEGPRFQLLQAGGVVAVWAFLLAVVRPAPLNAGSSRQDAVRLTLLALPALGMLPWFGLAALLTAVLAVTLAVLAAGFGRIAPRRMRKLAGGMAGGSLWAAFSARLVLIPVAATCGALPAPGTSDPEARLHALAEGDQADRRNACFAINPGRDRARRQAVHALLRVVPTLSAQALTDAGLVLLHGSSIAELTMAHALFTRAAFAGHAQAAGLQKAALDRLQLARGLTQVHGTQLIAR